MTTSFKTRPCADCGHPVSPAVTYCGECFSTDPHFERRHLDRKIGRVALGVLFVAIVVITTGWAVTLPGCDALLGLFMH
ncbi:hypothetical protein AWB78_08323 [Caballeronia calidae]|uniref:Uncharacterized protein n=1 Tax=Caballeronia calidae TaxID=1777139 RepID=A0A158ELX3_9BURK|nr:hypothetical protein [Caballeronia calidae]SAL06927.1 hypothetical protein AWB78_08323 [Caballeronia calidae]